MLTLYDFISMRAGRKKTQNSTNKDLILFRHMNNLINDVLSMFKYENMPNTINTEFFEMSLLFNGSVAVYKENNKLICAQGGDTDGVDIYGYGIKYLCQTVTGKDSTTITKGVDGIVTYNNLTRSPDFNIFAFANMFTELELSENLNVLFSRLTRLPYAEDTKQETQIKEAIKSILNGDFACIISDNYKDGFFQNIKTDKFLDLADVRNIPYLQYLSEYFDVLNKRFYTKYGHSLQTTSKHAQVSRDEINGLNSVSWIYPYQMLECRKKGIDEINKLFSTNISVEFSPIWRKEFEKYMLENSVDRIEQAEQGVDVNESEKVE